MHHKKHLPLKMFFGMNFLNFQYNFFDILNSNSYKRLNYVRNSDIKTYINSQIKNKNFAGYVLFTESTGDPEGIGAGIISYVSPIGTGNVYMEYMYERSRYYGWYEQSDDTDITWKSYKF